VKTAAVAASHCDGLPAAPAPTSEHARAGPVVVILPRRPTSRTSTTSIVLGGWGGALAQLSHQRHVLFINVGVVGTSVVSSESVSRPLSGTILCRVSDPAASCANDVVGHVGAVLALPRLVVLGPTVRASGCVSFSQSSVEKSQLPQLVPPQVILTLRHVHTLLDHLVDLYDSFLD